MRPSYILFALLTVAGCANAPTRDPLSEAQSLCREGFSEKSNSVVKGALEIAKAKASASAENSFSQEFGTAIGEALKNVKADNPQSLEMLLKEISAQRQCVMDIYSRSKPRTRDEITTDCVKSIQNRVDPKGVWPVVRNWSSMPNDGRASGDDFVLKFYVDKGGSDSFWSEALCVVRDNRFYDLQPVAAKK